MFMFGYDWSVGTPDSISFPASIQNTLVIR